MTQPAVLTFLHHYLPGYKSGGPIRTIANLVDHLGDEVEFHIVTADRDATDRTPYPHVAVGSWNAVGKARVLYTSPTDRGIRDFAALIRDTPAGVLYFNSFFDAVFTVRALLASATLFSDRRRIVIAPRGEFAPAALALKWWKKLPYLRLFRRMGFGELVTWQASSQYEAEDIHRVMRPPGDMVHVVPNLPAANAEASERPVFSAKPGVLRVLFLSRITPMKNLDFALRVLRRVTARVDFDIYGPMRDEAYWAECEQLIQGLPPQVAATYRGPVEPKDVVRIMGEYDLFFLPTRGENYGHVIAEALGAGTPVLISDTTPWRELEAHGAGWDLPLGDEEAFAMRIDSLAGEATALRITARERVYRYALERLNAEALVEANRRFFLALADRGQA